MVQKSQEAAESFGKETYNLLEEIKDTKGDDKVLGKVKRKPKPYNTTSENIEDFKSLSKSSKNIKTVHKDQNIKKSETITLKTCKSGENPSKNSKSKITPLPTIESAYNTIQNVNSHREALPKKSKVYELPEHLGRADRSRSMAENLEKVRNMNQTDNFNGVNQPSRCSDLTLVKDLNQAAILNQFDNFNQRENETFHTISTTNKMHELNLNFPDSNGKHIVIREVYLNNQTVHEIKNNISPSSNEQKSDGFKSQANKNRGSHDRQ